MNQTSDKTGTLYVLGTPIGNLQDFSPRAVQTLQDCDFVAAEDTRVTLKLLTHFQIKKPLTSYFEHNKQQKGEEILDRIAAGETCVLCTDAGMPAISDPGQDLVLEAHKRGIPVLSVPGPTAFATALALSGMDSTRFSFEGFLSINKKERREHLERLASDPHTLLFYEAPHKLSRTLKDLYEALGDRRLCIVRELTKIHEEVIHTDLAQAVKNYPDNNLKGELVLIVSGCPEKEQSADLKKGLALAKDLVTAGLSGNEASKIAAKYSNVKKNELYKALQEMKKNEAEKK